MKVLIVEDEPYAQNELIRLLKRTSFDIEVLDCLDSVEDTLAWLNSNPLPELMFLDIQLSDGLSFEIFNQIKIGSPVIFTTAFDEYAIRAFKVNSIDYLLKPIKQEDLQNALDKFYTLTKQKENKNPGLNLDQIEKLLKIQQNKFKSRFLVKFGDQLKYIETSEISYFKAEDNEVMLITKANNKYIIDYSLDQLKDLLDPDDFFRANRSYIISIQAIVKISKYFNSRLHLDLLPASNDQVLISRVKVPEFLKWMGQ